MITDHTVDGSAAPAPRRRCGPLGVALLCGLVVFVLVLRNDWWNWSTPGYQLFGFLPVGLWWQAGVSVLASLTMWALVRFAWPAHLEQQVAARPAEKPPAPDA